MPRPQKCRRVCALPASRGFEPVGEACPGEAVRMSVDEYEVMRLIDLEGLTQERCALQMGVARTTVTGIYNSVRRKLADAIVNRKRLRIGGGSYRLCEGPGPAGPGCGRPGCCKPGREDTKKQGDAKK